MGFTRGSDRTEKRTKKMSFQPNGTSNWGPTVAMTGSENTLKAPIFSKKSIKWGGKHSTERAGGFCFWCLSANPCFLQTYVLLMKIMLYIILYIWTWAKVTDSMWFRKTKKDFKRCLNLGWCSDYSFNVCIFCCLLVFLHLVLSYIYIYIHISFDFRHLFVGWFSVKLRSWSEFPRNMHQATW